MKIFKGLVSQAKSNIEMIYFPWNVRLSPNWFVLASFYLFTRTETKYSSLMVWQVKSTCGVHVPKCTLNVATRCVHQFEIRFKIQVTKGPFQDSDSLLTLSSCKLPLSAASKNKLLRGKVHFCFAIKLFEAFFLFLFWISLVTQ